MVRVFEPLCSSSDFDATHGDSCLNKTITIIAKIFYFLFLFLIYLLVLETVSEHACMFRGEGRRGRESESSADFVWSTEPDVGSHSL